MLNQRANTQRQIEKQFAQGKCNSKYSKADTMVIWGTANRKVGLI